MSESKSSFVVSSQTQPHKNLAKLVTKYQKTKMQDSIPKHAHDAFKIADQFVASDSIILDSGCGVGESSFRLAKQYPDTKVLAIDKSALRIQRSGSFDCCPDNLLILQADCVHFWRLMLEQKWHIKRHYLFYPNPWPKPGHLQRRWHAHPVFPTLIKLGGIITMRTNWIIYAQEFAQAIAMYKGNTNPVRQLALENAFTPFERKYINSQHALYEVQADLS